MQSPTGQSPHHQNRPEEEEEEDDGDEVPPIRSEMVWIVSVGTRPELDFVQVSPIQQETSDGVLIDASDITNSKDNSNNIHTSPSPTATSETEVISPAKASPTHLAENKDSSEDEWHSDEGPDNSSFGLMVTKRSQQDINEIMNTKKWLGLKSSDKSFRQQLDGIFHHEKKQKKQKNKKKSDNESSPEQDDDQKGVSNRHPEFGKENTMVRMPSSKKTHPFISRSISCDDHSPTNNRKNISQQQIEINKHANLLRRTCRFLSDSSATFHTSSSASQQSRAYFGESNSKPSILTTKRLARSQYNLTQNSDYVNRSQSLGDLTGDLGFTLPRGSQQSLNTYNSSTSNISSGSSTKTLTNGSSRAALRQSASRTAGGLYTPRYEKSRLNPDRHSKSFDLVTSSHPPHPKISSRQLSQPESYQSSSHVNQNGSQLSLHTGHVGHKMSWSQPHLQQQEHYLLQAPKRQAVQHAAPSTQHQQQKTAAMTAPNPSASKVSKPVGVNISNSNVDAQPHQQQQTHSRLSMSAKNSRPKPVCESNVVDQHRKFGSTDCINKLKPRRSLPRVPSENIDEKRRKFTELMKQRILLCSTASSNNSGNADTPLDYEVSSLLSLSELDANDNSSDSLKFKPIESAADVWKFQSLQDLTCRDDQQEKGTGEWKQIIPVICNESNNCSTHINRRSHSSTMDSGYSTIDTEVELYMPPTRFKPALNQNRSETDKKLCKSREFGSVDCLRVNTLGRVKGYHYPNSGTVKVKQVQEYSTLTSAQTGTSLRNVSRWETKSHSTQNLHSRSSRKVEGSLQAQKSFHSSSKLNNNNSDDILGHGGSLSAKTISNPNNSGNSNSMSPTSEPLNNATLHQLLQLYTLYPTELGAANLKSCLNDYIILEKKIVQLPVMSGGGISSGSCGNLTSGAGNKSVPQGKYTKLGGPGSAFRPVRSGSGLVHICQVSMTGIVFKSSCLSPPPIALSAIEDGDLVVEVNGILVLDQNTQAIKKLFYSTLGSGSLQLTLAHPKRAPISSVSSSFDSLANEEVQSLKEDIKLLTNELDRKEKLIKQLNSEKFSGQTDEHSQSPSPVFTHCQYHQDWTKNLDSLHLGEDEFVV